MDKSSISKPSLRRLPVYLSYLKTLPPSTRTISATAVAAALGLNEVQVRKDLSAASSSGGRPKMGYSVEELIADLEEFLGYRNTKDAILIGVGRLGGALLSFTGFQACGMRIAAAFDNDPMKIGTCIGGVQIHDILDFPIVCPHMGAHIGILTTSPEHAQALCDLMLEHGILAIWNFSTAHLEVPDNIIVHNENLAVSLAMISHDLEEMLDKEGGKNS
ncbi:MAG: redox-sensing transcriptional repressor Rex [Oscillospiraceae bacterium]|nr:redox-sensing transcriptional repressor Rex [Oscillospiraceae bacterium]